MAHRGARCHRSLISSQRSSESGQLLTGLPGTLGRMTPRAAPNSAPTIEAHGLTKHYGSERKGMVHALAGLDLVAPAGKVTAILGPNGAGKTTFVKAVATLLRPDAGSLTVAGIDAIAHPEQVRRVIGLAGQNAAVEPALTGRENLVMVARLFGHTAPARKQRPRPCSPRSTWRTMPTAR